MTTSTDKTVSPIRSRRTPKGGSLLIAAILIAILWVAWNRYGKAPWRTFAAAPTADIYGLNFVITFPDDWCPPAVSKVKSGDSSCVVFKRLPPAGPWRWLREHVEREGRFWPMEQVTFTMMPAEKVGAVDANSLLTLLQRMPTPPGDRRTSRRFEHPLGPAIDQIWVMKQHNGMPTLIARTLSIFLRERHGHAVVVTAECVMPTDVYSRDRADIDRMFQQCRVESWWPY